MEFVKWMDDLPLIGKVLFCLPGLDLTWAIYRIIKGATGKNDGLLIAGILWIIFSSFSWVIDLITTLIQGKPILTDNI